MTFIGFSTSIRPDEGYIKCPELWDKEYNQKYARLDSIADLLFYTVMLIKLLPVLWIILPQTVWYAVGAVFLLPYMFMTSYRAEYSWFVCALAFAASLEELAIHIFHNSYYADRKSVFQSASSK